MLTSLPDNSLISPGPVLPLPSDGANYGAQDTAFAQMIEQAYTKPEDEARPHISESPASSAREEEAISSPESEDESTRSVRLAEEEAALRAARMRGLLLVNLSAIAHGKTQNSNESQTSHAKDIQPGTAARGKTRGEKGPRNQRVSKQANDLGGTRGALKYQEGEFTREFKELASKLQGAKLQAVEVNQAEKFHDDSQRILEQKMTPFLKQLTQDGVKVAGISVLKAEAHAGLPKDGKVSTANGVNLEESSADAPDGTGPKAHSQDKSDDKSSGRDDGKPSAQGGGGLLNTHGKNKDSRAFSETLSSRFGQTSGQDAPLAVPGQGAGKGPELAGANAAVGKLTAATAGEAVQKIVELSEQKLHLGNNKLAIEVHVQNVGRISVDAVRHLEKIHIEIQVESQETRRMLQNHLRPFLDQMGKVGLDIGRLDVAVRDHRQDGQQFQDFSQHARRDGFKFGEQGQSREEQHQRRGARDAVMQRLIRNHSGGQRSVEIWA